MRQEAGQLVRLAGQFELRQQLLHPMLRPRTAREGTQEALALLEILHGQAQVFAHRQLENQVGDLERARQTGGEHPVGRQARHLAPIEVHRARAGTNRAADQVEQAALARPIGSDHRGDLPGQGLEAQILHRPQRAELHAQTIDPKNGAHLAALPCLDPHGRAGRAWAKFWKQQILSGAFPSDGHAVRLAMCNSGELARQVFKDRASQVFFY